MTKLSTDYPQIAAEREAAERRKARGDAVFILGLMVAGLIFCGAVLGIVGAIAWHVGTAVLRAMS